jgi:membrane fusion protein (multidrug efflux system)
MAEAPPQQEPQRAKENGNGGDKPPQQEQKKPPVDPARAKRRRLIIIAIGVVVVLGGFLYWLHTRHFEDTDDAQIDGYLTAISSRVPGTVLAVHADDNQEVKQGDVLVELDPADLQVSLAQANAAVAQAQSQLSAEQPNVSITQTSNRASVDTGEDSVANAAADLDAAKRDLEQAEANNKLAQQQKERAKQLLESKTIPQDTYDQRVAAADAANAALASARKRIDMRRASLQSAQSRLVETRANAPRQIVERQANLSVRQANLELAKAQQKQAELNFSYTKIVAPVAGVLGRRSVNIGDRVAPGQQLFSLAQTHALWVTANFRETQIELMKPGQEVEIHVDAVDKNYTGKVESFAAATGSRFSLLPPENATGNYVKVVQRIPVRIALDPNQPEMERLRPGMSAEPKVRVR